MKPLLVVMGVSGSGKTTVGIALAAAVDVPFRDADDLHPAANVAKMAAGIALTDGDRMPWLALVGAELAAAPGGLVIACSALKKVYRRAILAAAPSVRFVFLDGSRGLLESRVQFRRGHFMPAALLDSQLATLEPLAPDEPGVRVSLDEHLTVPSIVALVVAPLVVAPLVVAPLVVTPLVAAPLVEHPPATSPDTSPLLRAPE
ncbi:gluconokinase [Glaciihabitans sp. GrIS 2.15]|uniref:gluconokinase n=1 Tax=Glaciihabitans sp. GrIS 2.15 TaxID=3071710 RepID=UPI002E09B537|nr:gluconokinase [Glaciihabitans sp. GrIS 2.15]